MTSLSPLQDKEKGEGPTTSQTGGWHLESIHHTKEGQLINKEAQRALFPKQKCMGDILEMICSVKEVPLINRTEAGTPCISLLKSF